MFPHIRKMTIRLTGTALLVALGSGVLAPPTLASSNQQPVGDDTQPPSLSFDKGCNIVVDEGKPTTTDLKPNDEDSYKYKADPALVDDCTQELDEKTAQLLKEYIATFQELEARYPQASTADQREMLTTYGEKIATLYCDLTAGTHPCTPEGLAPTKEAETLALDVGDVWWAWAVDSYSFWNVGVIPEQGATCAANALVQMYHDDEDSGNANNRWGWLGATASTNNTLFKFCEVDGWQMYPIYQYSYATLKLGWFCPWTSYTVWRYFDNEDSANANWGSGNYFPNANVLGRNWLMAFCVSSAFPYSIATTFPTYSAPASYGVFALRSWQGRPTGYLYKDDQDFPNWNYWIGNALDIMGGSNNTWLKLAKVR